MKAFRRHRQLLWLLAGWLFIAPLLGFQHLYGSHSTVADDVCEMCVLSSGGGHALTPQIAALSAIAPVTDKFSLALLPVSEATPLRAKARAPPLT